MEFKFEGRLKLVTQLLMAVGVIALVGGFLTDHSDHHQRFWANLLINGFFYFTMALAALFFYALQYATESGWSAVLKRWFEALWGFLPWGAAVIVIVLVAGKLHLHQGGRPPQTTTKRAPNHMIFDSKFALALARQSGRTEEVDGYELFRSFALLPPRSPADSRRAHTCENVPTVARLKRAEGCLQRYGFAVRKESARPNDRCEKTAKRFHTRC